MDDDNNKALLLEAKKRYKDALEYWAEHQRKTTETLKFIAGDQWDENARQSFENNGFAAITDNVIPSFLRQITNELRQKTPTIEFNPLDNTHQDVAEVLTDLVRNIQLESNADIAFDVAGWNAAATGIGYFRIGSEYEDVDSFDQKICVYPIEDSNSVLPDPSHRSSSMEDSEYCFIRTAMSKQEYKNKYPKSALTGIDNDDPKGWNTYQGILLNKNEVIVCEYYKRDFETKTLYRVLNRNNGVTENTTEKPDDLGVLDGTLLILQTRETKVPVIRHFVLNEVEILAETTWPGKIIPVIAVKGDEIWIDNKRTLQGAVEGAIDSQVMLNYYLTLQSQLIQMAPKAPYIGTAKQFQTYEQQWADINVSGQAFITYNGDPEAAGPPSRDLGEVPIQNMGAMVNQARENLKQIFGIYDASLGNQGNETSGVAIIARQEQTYNSNFHFYDNLTRALRAAGRVLLDAIPTFYDSERTISTSQVDGTRSSVDVNGPNQPSLAEGKFVVNIQSGPSFGTKRQESVVAMNELGRVYPNAMPLIADIMANNMDWPGAKEVAARLRTAVPAEVLQATTGEDADPATLVPQLKTQLAQMTEQLKALNAHAEQVEGELKMTKMTLDFEKQDNSIALRKADQDYDIKEKQLSLSQEQTQAEYQLEMLKLGLEERKIAIQEQQLQMNATVAAADMVGDMFDRENDHIGRKMKHIPINSTENDGIGYGHLGGDLARNGI